MAVVMNITVFQCVMTCTLTDSQQYYTETYCHHLQVRRRIEVLHSSETLIASHQSTWQHILKDNHLHLHIARHGNIFWKTL